MKNKSRAELLVKGGLATEMRQTMCLIASSRMDLQPGQLHNYDMSGDSRVNLQMGQLHKIVTRVTG